MEGLTPDGMVGEGFFECPREVLLTKNRAQALRGAVGGGAQAVGLSAAILPGPVAVF